MRTRFALVGISVLVFALLIGIGVWVTAASSSEVGAYFSESWDPRLDLDKDGDVDVLDIQMVAAGWQSVAPTPTPLPGGCTAIGGPYFQDTIFPSGCYSVTRSLQVPNAVTMTLQAGSTFYFCSTAICTWTRRVCCWFKGLTCESFSCAKRQHMARSPLQWKRQDDDTQRHIGWYH